MYGQNFKVQNFLTDPVSFNLGDRKQKVFLVRPNATFLVLSGSLSTSTILLF